MFLGVDIHKREAQVAVRNDDGEVIEQVRVIMIKETFENRGTFHTSLLQN